MLCVGFGIERLEQQQSVQALLRRVQRRKYRIVFEVVLQAQTLIGRQTPGVSTHQTQESPVPAPVSVLLLPSLQKVLVHQERPHSSLGYTPPALFEKRVA